MRHPAKALALLALATAVSACGGQEQEEPAKKTTVETPAAGIAAGEATPIPAATPPAAFFQCRSCHSVEPGKNGIGPTLAGIWGDKAGVVPGFEFSEAMKNSGLTWNQANLDRYLTDPRGVVPGTKMAFGGVKDAGKRQEIINYLKTL